MRLALTASAIRVPDGAVLLVTLRAEVPGDLWSAVWPPRFKSRNPNSADFQATLAELEQKPLQDDRFGVFVHWGLSLPFGAAERSRLTGWSIHDGTGAGRVVEPLVPMAGVDDVGLVVSDVRRGTLLRTALGVVSARRRCSADTP
jgi:hypothetical protein